MDTNTLSAHAKRRIQQRGIPVAVLELVLAEHDRCTPVGDGCSSIWLSRQEADRLRTRYPNQLVDAATRHAVISNKDGQLVTVLKIARGKRGRWYRRG
jgi:hypothetical protein